jgi:hypothetical protein
MKTFSIKKAYVLLGVFLLLAAARSNAACTKQMEGDEWVVRDARGFELGRSLSMARATEIEINAENGGRCMGHIVVNPPIHPPVIGLPPIIINPPVVVNPPVIVQPGLGGVYPGAQVLEKRGSYSVQRVLAVAQDGRALLENGLWYDSYELSALTNQLGTLVVGAEALETRGSLSIQTITALALDGTILLSNGVYYADHEVQALVYSNGRFQVGQNVLETRGSVSIQRIEKISEEGKYLLSNGVFYDEYEIQHVWQ